MAIKYMKTCWNDVTQSKGWFGKLVKFSLLSFVPVFGQMTTNGYLLGWGREVAWGMRRPLPARIFENADGKQFWRGWFALVISFLFSLIPGALSYLGEYLWMPDPNSGQVSTGGILAVAVLLMVAGTLLTIVAYLYSLVGSMRSAIYGKLAPGLQVKQIHKLIGQDRGGMLRIFGMAMAVLAIAYAITYLIVIIGAMLILFSNMSTFIGLDGGNPDFTMLFAQLGIPFIVLLAVASFIAILVFMFGNMLITRAVGYWMYQFNVPMWRGPKDPLPFEQGVPNRFYQCSEMPAARLGGDLGPAPAHAVSHAHEGVRLGYRII